MTFNRAAWSALSFAKKKEFIQSLSDEESGYFLHQWEFWARDNQLPPAGNWKGWLLLAGRGFGKTRTAAEFIKSQIDTCSRIAIIGRTAQDASDVVVNGESGILAVFHPSERPRYIESRRLIEFKNGSIATVYSADQPETFRGPQHELAWFDELACYKNPEEVFNQVQLGLRLGRHPRWVATTTPRPIPLIRALVKDPTVQVVRGSTLENKCLSESFINDILRQYEGTRLGRQEIYGEILDDNPNALFSRKNIDQYRTDSAPPLYRVVIAIDPAVTATGDETGIIVAGIGKDNHFYILEDATQKGTPSVWGQKAVALYDRYRANMIVGETNNGGDLVEMNIRACGGQSIPYKAVHASRSKFIRAEPVAALYEQGKVHHVGSFNELEDELCTWDPTVGKSPNHLDAMVWAITYLVEHISNSATYQYQSCNQSLNRW